MTGVYRTDVVMTTRPTFLYPIGGGDYRPIMEFRTRIRVVIIGRDLGKHEQYYRVVFAGGCLGVIHVAELPNEDDDT